MTTKLAFDLTRVWQHFQNKKFGIVSAYLSSLSRKENEDRQKQLKKDVREKGYGYKELKGAWRPNKEETIQFEFSLFIPNLIPADAIELGKKYNQYAVVYADEDKIVLDKLSNEPNEVFTKLEKGFKEGWIAWSEYRRHKFKYSTVEWNMPEPPIARDFMSSMALESYNNDVGISEYPRDLKRALLLNNLK